MVANVSSSNILTQPKLKLDQKISSVGTRADTISDFHYKIIVADIIHNNIILISIEILKRHNKIQQPAMLEC